MVDEGGGWGWREGGRGERGWRGGEGEEAGSDGGGEISLLGDYSGWMEGVVEGERG